MNHRRVFQPRIEASHPRQSAVRCTAIIFFLLVAVILSTAPALTSPASAQADNPAPPAQPVKLIFIHHSCGENWLADDNGGLGQALAQNNYFVSDTNYGWGPDAIGDRTDIVNWTEWFRGSESGRYLAALYAESGQNSAYTRSLSDPGGENQVILFKSCFPNSNLEGQPNDPPSPGSDLTVGNAKYIYNDLLQYFRTRPDKLFVVITAPPLIDASNAANARAFNTWLVRDWLSNNGYTQPNVAVFDFYNLLTAANNHHRFNNGQVEYVNNQGGNTAFYPSGDDHPSAEGNRKATAEFVPMLNVFYHRWLAGGAAQPPAAQPPTAQAVQAPTEAPTEAPPAALPTSEPPASGGAPSASAPSLDIIGSMEQPTPAWETYRDEATSTQITCAPDNSAAHSGASALHATFNVAANSWATCIVHLDAPQDWSNTQGLSLFLRASQPALVFDVVVYAGPPDQPATYERMVEAVPESTSGWVELSLPWEEFHRVSWEDQAGTPFEQRTQVNSVGLGFNTPPDAPNVGSIWIDDLRLLGAGSPPPAAATPPSVAAQPSPQVEQPTLPPQAPTRQPTQVPESNVSKTPGRACCPATAGLPLAFVAAAWLLRRRHR